jgi:hypothetical protein
MEMNLKSLGHPVSLFHNNKNPALEQKGEHYGIRKRRPVNG